MNTDPRNGEELGAPFYHAAVAAALGYEVDVVCTATAGKLLKTGVAEALDVLSASKWDPVKAGLRLGCSGSQLVKLLKEHPPAMLMLNERRRERGERELK